MDLEYWVDYVSLFGVKEMIPLYDKMNPITYRNWDVYMLTFSVIFIVLYLVSKVVLGALRMIRRCCYGGSKVKTD